jgi:hypothetical protein
MEILADGLCQQVDIALLHAVVDDDASIHRASEPCGSPDTGPAR